jgi:hypothetical protein
MSVGKEFCIYIGDIYINIKSFCKFRTPLNSLNTYINYESHILTLSLAIFIIHLVIIVCSNFDQSWCRKEIKMFSTSVVILVLRGVEDICHFVGIWALESKFQHLGVLILARSQLLWVVQFYRRKKQ